jgi:hypothetical protein
MRRTGEMFDGRELQDSAIVANNVYNMDETAEELASSGLW